MAYEALVSTGGCTCMRCVRRRAQDIYLAWDFGTRWRKNWRLYIDYAGLLRHTPLGVA